MTCNINITGFDLLIKPTDLINQLPANDTIRDFIISSRKTISNIIHKRDKRLLCIVGPCSIHNIKEAKDYANMLMELKKNYKDKLFIVMRVYFEKPRTTVGWKGLINDPYLNGSFRINEGLELARSLLLYLNGIGMPCGVEFLDNIIPQYIGDLVSWGAIGARTSESQIHREMVSGMSMPIGFKNGTDGNVQISVDAIKCASAYHHFLSISNNGEPAIAHTKGNSDCHVILRGGNITGPNYEREYVYKCQELLDKYNINHGIMIDCSHGNSQKKHKNQIIVCKSIAEQLKDNRYIIGLMIESNINEGTQKIGSELKYGVSVTDECVNIATTKDMLEILATVL